MFRRLRRIVHFLPLAATVALACSAPVASKAPAARSGDPALWAVSDADTTIYLFGSVHMLKPDAVWFDDEVRAAFDRSDTLVLEVTEGDPAKLAAMVAPMAANTSGQPTSAMLPPKTRERYLAALKHYRIPAAAMDAIEPWLVAINLSIAPLEELGYRQDIGVEKTLETAARNSGKTVMGLETVEQQLGFFDQLPPRVQVAYLATTVDELPKAEKEFAALMRHWLRGRPDKLATLMDDSIRSTPELAKPLLFDRNARWAGWVGQRLDQPGTVFVAVGAGHLAGKDSVIDLLQKRGLAVRRLSMRDFAGS